VARKWGYRVKGVPAGRANIVVAANNFHGRTTTVISFSDDPDARADFGPYTPGFRAVPFGDAAALAAAIDGDTVAVLLEPVQGEAGVILPPPGYLARVRELCTRHNVLFIADEVQSGLARTGRTLACEHYGVVPDMYLLGKALGGGVVPVSAVLADADVLGVLRPGQHGSTFGGNPLACAVGRAVVGMLATGEYQERARARRHRRAQPRVVGRHRRRPRAGHRPGGLRTAARARRAGEGHPRPDPAPRPAAGDRAGRAGRRGRGIAQVAERSGHRLNPTYAVRLIRLPDPDPGGPCRRNRLAR
jgi:acetylornithine/succinyldiaminopimelate/putrescine aminotransferase